MLLIVGNIIVMALEADDADQETYLLLEYLNNVFTVCFVVEAFLKIVTLKFKNYLHNKWNRFYKFIEGLILS